MATVPDGFILVCKRGCPTCTMIEPVMIQLEGSKIPLTIYAQDDPSLGDQIDIEIRDWTTLVADKLDLQGRQHKPEIDQPGSNLELADLHIDLRKEG